jgi:YD repeat-containing protein
LSYFPPGDAGKQTGMLRQVTGPWVADTSSGSPAQNVTTYTYDQVGRRLTLVDPVGNAPGATGDHTSTFAYDNEDRPTSVTAPAPSGSGAKLTTSFAYDPVGNRTSVTDANTQITRYQYDARDSLSEVDQSATTLDPNNDTAKIVTQYQYDHLGNLSRVLRAATDTSNVRATDYAYDGLNRVRTETQYPSWPTTTPTLVTQSTFDGNGNRTRLQDPADAGRGRRARHLLGQCQWQRNRA